MNNILINDVEKYIRLYLETKHQIDSSGFIIRLSDNINSIYERHRTYIMQFPLINPDLISQIISCWSEYALENIIENYNLHQRMTILAIEPLKIASTQNEIIIKYINEKINPEIIIRQLSLDIIEQMNKHMIELYMDQNYPNIDINDSEQENEYNEIFDSIDIEQIYSTYPQAEIYIPLKLKSKMDSNDIIFYINGTINTTSHIINIVDDIRICLESDNQDEIISYAKDEIVYKYGKNKELQQFSIITDPQI